MSVSAVCIRFPVIVQGEVKHFQRRTKRNGAISSFCVRVSGIAPQLGTWRSYRISAEVVVTDMSELMFMGLGIGPLLARDSCLRCVGLSSVIKSICRPVLATHIILIRYYPAFITPDHIGHGQKCQQKAQHCQWKLVFFLVGCVVHDKMELVLVRSPSYNLVSVRVEWNMFWPPVLHWGLLRARHFQSFTSSIKVS